MPYLEGPRKRPGSSGSRSGGFLRPALEPLCAQARAIDGQLWSSVVPYWGLPNAYINACTRAGVPVNRSVGGWR